MAVGQLVFISYSRQQLYFAEALSLRLQKSGVNAWMDLQQLEPGGDWQGQINKALQSCTALVLVGSRQALASPYVQQEWESAQAAGKPVYIALYEAICLPDSLQNAPLVDFRGAFKPAVKALANRLLGRPVVWHPVPQPNRLNIPTRLPPGIRLIFWLLIISALTLPPLMVNSFPPFVSPVYVLANALLMSVLLLWWAWRFLHHRFRLQTAGIPLLLPFIIYGFYRMSSAFTSGFDERFFGEWMGMIAAALLTLLVFSWILGPELLRWSVPGDEIQGLRRWFNQPARRGNRAATRRLLNDVLAVRAVQTAGTPLTATPPRGVSLSPEPVTSSPGTYSLHYARNDQPVAAKLRRALASQKLREVDQGGRVHILVVSQYLSRSELQKLLAAPVQKALLLVDNVAIHGDTLMEQAVRLQMVDYRDRSRKILHALARTLQDLTASNLPTGVETTPKSFQETILPLGARQVGAWVLCVGAYLFLSGLAGLGFGLLGVIPLAPLDLSGLVVGPLIARLGSAFWRRRTTRWAFVPAFAFSIWLTLFISMMAFFMFSSELPDNPMLWILTPSRMLTYEEFPLLCFLPFTFFLVPFILWDHLVRFKDWLPASARLAKGQNCLQPLADRRAGRWVFLGWVVGAFLVFGLPLMEYLAFYFLSQIYTF